MSDSEISVASEGRGRDQWDGSESSGTLQLPVDPCVDVGDEHDDIEPERVQEPVAKRARKDGPILFSISKNRGPS
jgi:hypothetical protein